MARKGYSEEKRKMFRSRSAMEDKLEEFKEQKFIIIRSGFICERTYRNFGFKYGIVYREPIKKKGKKQ